ncbi:calcium-binding protein [Leisingera sp. D0M16]
MVTYVVQDETDFNTNGEVSEDHFGVNLVTIYDEEYGEDSSNLSSLVEEMGITNLRYPGGAATEYYFDMADPNANVSNAVPEQTLLPMDQMFEQAGMSGLSVSVVVSTRTAFEQSASEAMLRGNYGNRRDISWDYLEGLSFFLEELASEAIENGVKISAIELGNEFWGSGEMTASEYGYLVSHLLPFIEDFFIQRDMDAPDLIVQSTSSASAVYSPREDTIVYIDPEMDMHGIYSLSYIDENFGGVVPEGWIAATVEGQGSAYSQVSDIVSQINNVPGSADLVDGVLHHYYVSTGLSSVDEANRFMFSQYARFEELLQRSTSLAPLSFHVTEWNSNFYGEDARGMEHASMIVEMFYEQITHGIDVSQIWPLTFDTTQSITLTDVTQENLTIAGETFSLMRETLVGMSPVLDWSVDGEIDIHGFSSGEDFVFIISERCGEEHPSTSINFSEIVGDDYYFVRSTMLTDGGRGGADHRTTPVLSYGSSQTTSDGTVEIDQEPWALSFVELTRIGNGNDVVKGSDSQDNIMGLAGDDTIRGNAATDRIYGNSGNDKIYGGVGRDYLYGGQENDQLFGNAGRDRIGGGSGADTIYGGTWHDTIFGSFGNDSLLGGGGCDKIYGGWGSDTILGGKWDDTIFGGRGRDFAYGELGRDVISGGRGHDFLSGGGGDDTIAGGRGNDTILGGDGHDRLFDGAGSDKLTGGEGADHFVFVRDGHEDCLTDFEAGLDLLDLRLWGAESFEDLQLTQADFNGTPTTLLVFDQERLVLNNVTIEELQSAIHGGSLII